MGQVNKATIGEIGEDVATKKLLSSGFKILARNFRKPWGEIDIIAKKDNVLHFVEVKAVSENFHGKHSEDEYMPEDNVHSWKLQRLQRAIQTFLIEHKIPEDQEWQIDVMAVFLDLDIKKARIRVTEDI